MTQETLKLALDAMNAMLTHMGMDEEEWNKVTFDQMRQAIAAIKKALAQPEQEPVFRFQMQLQDGWGGQYPKAIPIGDPDFESLFKNIGDIVTFYTAPPQPEKEPVADDFFRMIADRNPKPFPLQRTWVGLTEEEKELIVGMSCKKDSSHDDAERVAKAIEAKLKEKNNG